MKTLTTAQVLSVSAGLDTATINSIVGFIGSTAASQLFTKALGYSLTSTTPLPLLTSVAAGGISALGQYGFTQLSNVALTGKFLG